MTGVLMGLFVDSILRRFDGSRRWQRMQLGQSMVSMSDKIAGRLHRSLISWPHNIFDLRADLASLFVNLNRAGFDLSLNTLMRRDDDGVLLVNYLQYVGTMLSDGHFKQAEEAAQEVTCAFVNVRHCCNISANVPERTSCPLALENNSAFFSSGIFALRIFSRILA